MRSLLVFVALVLYMGVDMMPSYALSLTPLEKEYTLQILGSGGPISDDKRASSGAVIWWQGKSRILIDAGGGVYLRFGQSGARLEDVDFVGITHFHTDHVTDLPALLKGGIFFERSRPLHIAGPSQGGPFPSLTHFMDAMFSPKTGAFAYLSGIYDGTGGLFPVTMQDVNYKKKTATKVYEKNGITIWAQGIPHGNVPCLAYRIETNKGVIVMSADQNGTDSDFIDFAKGADFLVMPAAIDENADKASKFLHSSPSRIGKIAQKIHPKVLILNHWMGRGLFHKKAVIKEIRNYYKGTLYAGRDLAAYPISLIRGK